MNSAKIIKVLLLIFTIIYCVMPIDVCPGPVDDVIVILLNHAMGKKLITEK